MTNEMWQNLVFVMQETVNRKFDLPIHVPRVKWSILLKGVLARTKSGSLEPYSNCGMFNIRVLKAIGVKNDPLELVMPSRLRNVQGVLGYAFVKSFTAGYYDPSSSSIDANMKDLILRDDNKEFLFLHPDFRDVIRHYKGPNGSYDYSNQTVIAMAVKSLRNWTLLIKSLWFAL
jgi:hypothetical protein